MTIEKVLEKILEELQTLNGKIPAAGTEFAPTPPVVNSTSVPATVAAAVPTTAAPPAVELPAVTRAEVGQALIELAKLDHEAANQSLRDFGAPSPAMGEIKPADYPALLAKVKALTEALSKKANLL